MKKQNLLAEIFDMEGNVCPECGSASWSFKGGDEMRDNIKVYVVSGYECLECGHVGNELISEEEFKNQRRTKLIDDILK